MRLLAPVVAAFFGLCTVVVTVSGDGDLALGADAEATTSILMTLEELALRSNVAFVAEPVERTSRWEEVAGGKRIVTYTRLVVHERLLGPKDDASTTNEVWVRTLGGTVDKIGQQVAGEATFRLGERSVVFLAKMDQALVVTGMAQGHYPLREIEGQPRLASSASPGNLLPRRGPSQSARERLLGRTLDEARVAIARAAKAMGK
jgi:hypothetical protein